jgi:hypothetical protein
MQEPKRGARKLKPRRAAGVYFVRCGDFVKIGYATYWSKRLGILKIGNPHPMQLLFFVCEDRQLEIDYHIRFAAQWHRGEWFRCEGALGQFLRDILASHDTSLLSFWCPREIPAERTALDGIIEA